MSTDKSAPLSPHALEFENLEVFYGDQQALFGINLQIPREKVTVIIGPSGCGKSTSLRCINRLVEFQGGYIYYNDEPIKQYEVNELRRNMGYAIQSVGLFPHMTVADNIGIVPRLLGWDLERRRSRATELIQLVGLEPDQYLEKFPHQLSGGEAQRVGVARALAADPDILLMDEPFGAVDPLNREILQDEFVRIQRRLKKTIVFVTHDLEEAVRLADYLVIMKDGTVVQADTPESILANPLNDFVVQFLGPDRALKRLTLFTVDKFQREAKSLYEKEAKDLIASGSLDPETIGLYWELDGEGRPMKVHCIEDERTRTMDVDLNAHALRPYSSLKEALSHILSLGMQAAPIIDEEQKLIGEIHYEQIERISLQS